MSIGHIVFAHDEVIAMHRKLDDLRLNGRTGTSAESIIISGPSGSGKTQIAQAYLNKFPVQRLPTGDVRPVVYVEAPKLYTEKAFAEAILIALGTRPRRASSEAVIQEIIRQMRLQRVELLILDESHHLSGEGVGTFLKSLLNRTGTPIAFVGMASTEGMIRHSEFQRRCRGIYRTKTFDWFVEKESKNYCSLLNQFQEHMKVKPTDFNLYDEMVAARINFACYGLIGHTVALLRKVEGVVFTSDQEDKSTFSMRAFEEAYSQLAFGGHQALKDYKRSPFGDHDLPAYWQPAPHHF